MTNGTEERTKDGSGQILNFIAKGRAPYTSFTRKFWWKQSQKLAQVLPIIAMGHPEAEVRRVAEELFMRLFVVAD